MPSENRYRVIAKLGQGGMGTVYRAEDVTLRRPVALKLLPESMWAESQLRARLLREARVAAALNHPNVCTIYEIGECKPGDPLPLEGEEKIFAPGTPFIAMELVEGKVLSEILKSGPIPIDELLRLAGQIAEGLSEAHRHRVVHRDLKPQNVMVTPSGRVKILDFGLAKPLAPLAEDVGSAVETLSRELTREGMVVGTVSYMSPEQAMGKPVDSRSDLFSFGTLLYEMAAGVRPFRGENPASTLAKILEVEPEPLSGLKGDLPDSFVEIVTRCLRKRPEERYTDSEELSKELEELRFSLTTGKRPLVRSKGKRNALTMSLLALGALALVAGLAFLLRGNLFAPPALPAKHTQLTFFGDARTADISPDGRFIAYTRGMPGSTVFVQEIGGGQAINVFEGAIEDLAWSPDGTRFAGHSYGGRSITLTDKASGETRAIAFEGDFPKGPSADFGPIGMDWSAEGDRLVLGDYEDETHVLFTLNVNVAEPVPILADEAYVASPRWSPEGDAVYYLRGSEHTSEIWKLSVNSRTGRARGDPRLVAGGLNIQGFALSGDGKRLVYTRSLAQSNLWLVLAEESQGRDAAPRQITTGTAGDAWPAVSPDGSLVAFARFLGETSYIYVIPIEGGEARQLTFAGSANGPAWSPDGKEIAFFLVTDGIQRVATVSANGGTPRVFANARPFVPDISWAPGTRIVYTGEDRKLRILDPLTEKESIFPSEDGEGTVVMGRLSPDATRIAADMVLGPGEAGFVVAELDSGARRIVSEERWSPIAWSADGREVYARGDTEIFRVPVEGGAAKLVARLPFAGEELGWAAVTPDGRGIVSEVNREQTDVWLMENFDPEIR